MATGTHTLLERITVGGATAAEVTFSSIPQTGYTDLKVVMSVRDTYSAVSAAMFVKINGTTTLQSSKYTQGSGSATVSGDLTTLGLAGLNTGATATSSTFSNIELYIPNYKSSSYKSYSADSVTENNATEAYTNNIAGLWSSTAAITSLGFTCGTAFAQYSTFSLYGIAASGVTPTLAPKAAGGDIIQTDGTYWYHAFINTGAFVPAVGLTCDVLVVAGGGGGGGTTSSTTSSGGGGAGGVVYTASQSFANGTSYTTTVGAGGAGGTGSNAAGTSGVNSNITGGVLSLTAAVGGGGGGANISGAAKNGGSGGGAPGYPSNGTGGTGTSGQGNAGGSSTSNPIDGGCGGGGAGAAGQNSTAIPTNTSPGTNGGIGINTYSSLLSATGLGVSGYIAGGGGGGAYSTAQVGLGGSGGGADGKNNNAATGNAGTANTGGGGGGVGGNGTSGNLTGGAGGSGLIIIRYPV